LFGIVEVDEMFIGAPQSVTTGSARFGRIFVVQTHECDH
jgi:hypothetical protein